MNRVPSYPEALVLAHPNMSAAVAIAVARRDGRQLVQTTSGNFRYVFPRAVINGPREVGVELAGSRGCGKAGFANCGTRTPGANSQWNGVTAGETAPFTSGNFRYESNAVLEFTITGPSLQPESAVVGPNDPLEAA